MSDQAGWGIRGQNVCLRAICRDDLESLRRFVNDPEVMQYSNVFQPINDYQQEKWFEQISSATDSVWFAIDDVRREEPQLIGTCCLVGIDWVGRAAELRIRIGDREAWGQRLGSEACHHLITYGFQDLNLERIWLRVFASNARAIRMYEGLGFQVEGRLRRTITIKGVAEDLILMGLLRMEWESGAAGEGRP
ncbi:MAG: GNAT family N-acetyltransferase [Chloroflexi bacterium]|nr:GNAT family N-acetyltransferase [Chloroflexota bacterium]MCI0645015.1 GNAT family N-acetyltransferase [Chloroflexota bacterium]MCI0725590.1 GNAT family N-acetyltransferase [Chloroflexota bacterium]